MSQELSLMAQESKRGVTFYVYDLSAVQLETEQGILSHQAKVMQKCILHYIKPRFFQFILNLSCEKYVMIL